MRDDLLEIIEHTSKKGLPVIISTNGTLVNKHKIQVLSHFDIDLISVSLDTIDADKFDYMRGVTGTCKLAVNCIKEVKKAGIPVQVQALITDVNLEGLTELVRFCWNEGLLLSFQGLWHNYTKNSLSPNTYFWPRNSAYAAEVVSNIINIKKSGKSSIVDSIGYLKGLREYYRDAPSFVSNPQNRCLAFRKNLRIMDDGDVTTCFYSPSLGNIMKEHNTQALWTSDEAEEIRRRMAACNRNCSFIRCYYYDSFIEKIVKMQTFLKALRK